MAKRTPFLAAASPEARQNGEITSSHWRSSSSTYSRCHVQVTQLGYVPPPRSPGQPLIVTTVETPTSPARSSVLLRTSCAALRLLGSGSNTFPLQFNALRIRP